jgi:hypothetical protein
LKLNRAAAISKGPGISAVPRPAMTGIGFGEFNGEVKRICVVFKIGQILCEQMICLLLFENKCCRPHSWLVSASRRNSAGAASNRPVAFSSSGQLFSNDGIRWMSGVDYCCIL